MDDILSQGGDREPSPWPRRLAVIGALILVVAGGAVYLSLPRHPHSPPAAAPGSPGGRPARNGRGPPAGGPAAPAAGPGARAPPSSPPPRAAQPRSAGCPP